MVAAPPSPDSPRGQRRVLLGRVVGAHGLQGELRLQSWTDPPEAILGYRPWLLSLRGQERSVPEFHGRSSDKGLIVRLPGVADRSQAEALKGAEVFVLRAQLPPAGAGEYYWVDLEGLSVRTVAGVELGWVEKVIPTGANEVLEVRGDRTRLLPFVLGDCVRSVDLDAGLIVVDWDPDF